MSTLGPARWVHKTSRVPRPDEPGCRACGTRWGGYPDRLCPVVTCLACGTEQCMANGLSRGQCGVCFYGLLPGWSGSDRPCGYKRCPNRAVAAVGGQARYACREHLARNRMAEKIEAGLARREGAWVLADWF